MKLAFTIKEAADALSMGQTKVYEAIKLGKLNAVKYGRRTFIKQTDLEAFLDSFENIREKDEVLDA